MTREEAIKYWEQFNSEIDELANDNLYEEQIDELERQREVVEFTISALRAQHEQLDKVSQGHSQDKPMTNADRIRAMSDEELAKFLDDTQRMECESLHVLLHDGTIRFDSCKNGWLVWLQQPAED